MASEYYECPECGWVISFKFNGNRYVSICPFCRNELEIEREEFERDKVVIREVYFEKE